MDMKKIVLVAALASLVVPGIAVAQTTLPSEQQIIANANYVRDASGHVLSDSSRGERPAMLQRVHWYYDANGVAWSNICQTPNFWVSFGQRYYVVGSQCIARYNGMEAWGVMVAR